MERSEVEEFGVGVVLIRHLDLCQVDLVPEGNVKPPVRKDVDVVESASLDPSGALTHLVRHEECQVQFLLVLECVFLFRFFCVCFVQYEEF